MGVEQYSIIGVLIAGIVWLANFLVKTIKKHDTDMKEHRSERDEFRKTIEKQFDESNKNTKENTGVLQGLKTLLENKK